MSNRSEEWLAGYDLGRAGKPYLRTEADVSEDYADGRSVLFPRHP